jgi:hypothetical protein
MHFKQLEREDMLDNIRELTTQLKLKTLIIENFVPKTSVVDIESRAVWNKEKDNWDLPKYGNIYIYNMILCCYYYYDYYFMCKYVCICVYVMLIYYLAHDIPHPPPPSPK